MGDRRMEGREPASNLQASGIEVPAWGPGLGIQPGFHTKTALTLPNAIRLSLIPPAFLPPMAQPQQKFED